MVKNEPSQREVIGQLQIDVAVIKTTMNEVRVLQRSMSGKIDGFSYVKQADFDDFRVYADKTYATKDEVSPLKKFSYGFVGAFGIGGISFIFWLLERTLK